eukprot:2922858-Prymnesium_polylepis.2
MRSMTPLMSGVEYDSTAQEKYTSSLKSPWSPASNYNGAQSETEIGVGVRISEFESDVTALTHSSVSVSRHRHYVCNVDMEHSIRQSNQPTHRTTPSTGTAPSDTLCAHATCISGRPPCRPLGRWRPHSTYAREGAPRYACKWP